MSFSVLLQSGNQATSSSLYYFINKLCLPLLSALWFLENQPRTISLASPRGQELQAIFLSALIYLFLRLFTRSVLLVSGSVSAGSSPLIYYYISLAVAMLTDLLFEDRW